MIMGDHGFPALSWGSPKLAGWLISWNIPIEDG